MTRLKEKMLPCNFTAALHFGWAIPGGQPQVTRGASRSFLWGFKQFNRVARRVIQQNLIAAHAGDDLVAKVNSGFTQGRDFAGKITYFKLKAVPPPAQVCVHPS